MAFHPPLDDASDSSDSSSLNNDDTSSCHSIKLADVQKLYDDNLLDTVESSCSDGFIFFEASNRSFTIKDLRERKFQRSKGGGGGGSGSGSNKGDSSLNFSSSNPLVEISESSCCCDCHPGCPTSGDININNEGGDGTGERQVVVVNIIDEPKRISKTCRTFGLSKLANTTTTTNTSITTKTDSSTTNNSNMKRYRTKPDSTSKGVGTNTTTGTSNSSSSKESLFKYDRRKQLSEKILETLQKTERILEESTTQNNTDNTTTNQSTGRINMKASETRRFIEKNRDVSVSNGTTNNNKGKQNMKKQSTSKNNNTNNNNKSRNDMNLLSMHMSLPILPFHMSDCDNYNNISASPPKRSANVMRMTPPPVPVPPRPVPRPAPRPSSPKQRMMSPLHELTVRPSLSPLSCITYEDDDYSISTNECPGSTDTRFRSPCTKLRQHLQQLKQLSLLSSSSSSLMTTTKTTSMTTMMATTTATKTKTKTKTNSTITTTTTTTNNNNNNNNNDNTTLFQLPLDCSSPRKVEDDCCPSTTGTTFRNNDNYCYGGGGMDAPPRAPQRDRSPIRKTAVVALHLSFTETTTMTPTPTPTNCF